MGLDQFAYTATKERSKSTRELAYWRKHPNLQGWMEQLWISKNKLNGSSGQEDNWGSGFNGIELELTWEDLVQLEEDIHNGTMSSLQTTGFFFGNPSDDHYKEQDLEFIRNAKAELIVGLRVFYNSSW